jgi:hypothetical protein
MMLQDFDNEQVNENLRKWFKEKWVRFGPDGKIRGDCARGDSSEGKPKCLPQAKAHALGKKGRASAARRKRREDPNPEGTGKAINVKTKKESINEVSKELLKKYIKANVQDQLLRSTSDSFKSGRAGDQYNKDPFDTPVDRKRERGLDRALNRLSGRIIEDQHDQAAEEYRAHLIKTMPQIMQFLGKAIEGWRPSEEQMMAAIETAYNVMKHTGDIKQAEEAMVNELKAEEYRAHLIKTMPQIMQFLGKAIEGWRPSEEQMMAAIETAYNVMKHTGDKKQAGKAMMDELNTLHRISQGQQGLSEGSDKTFTVVYYSKQTDRNVTKQIKASSESELWDRLRAKGIDVVSVKEQGVAETSDYFRRREREEAIISGKKPARKKPPAQTSDYARRRAQEKKAEQDVAEMIDPNKLINHRGGLSKIAARDSLLEKYAMELKKIQEIRQTPTGNIPIEIDTHVDFDTGYEPMDPADPSHDLPDRFFSDNDYIDVDRNFDNNIDNDIDAIKESLDGTHNISEVSDRNNAVQKKADAFLKDLEKNKDKFQSLLISKDFQEWQPSNQQISFALQSAHQFLSRQISLDDWPLKLKQAKNIIRHILNVFFIMHVLKARHSDLKPAPLVKRHHYDKNLFHVIGSYPFGETVRITYQWDSQNKKLEKIDTEIIDDTTKKTVTEQNSCCPKCGGLAYNDLMLSEKKDACYFKVKKSYKKWPSAYASGSLVKCRKVGAKNWGNKSK